MLGIPSFIQAINLLLLTALTSHRKNRSKSLCGLRFGFGAAACLMIAFDGAGGGDRDFPCFCPHTAVITISFHVPLFSFYILIKKVVFGIS